MLPVWRLLLIAAGLILAGTALLEATGFTALTEVLRDVTLPEPWEAALRGAWIFFAVQLAVLAGYCAFAAARPAHANDTTLTLVGLLLAANTALLGGFLGAFPGTLLVGVATALVVGALMIRRG